MNRGCWYEVVFLQCNSIPKFGLRRQFVHGPLTYTRYRFMFSSLRPSGALCLTLLIAVGMLTIGCNSESEPITASTSNYEVAESDEPESSVSEAGGAQSDVSAAAAPANAGAAVISRPTATPGAERQPTQPSAAVRTPTTTQTRPQASSPAQTRTPAQTQTPPPRQTAANSATRNPSQPVAPTRPSSEPPPGGRRNSAGPKSQRAEDLHAFLQELATREPKGITDKSCRLTFSASRR